MTGGQTLLSFAFEDWARENVVRAFVLVWGGAVLLWLVLDWLGNPNRGRFRPLAPHRGRGIRGRITAWRLQRDTRDAEIRETLRATYGKSSLRFDWSNVDETTATAHDESRLSPVPQLLELGAKPVSPPPTLDTEILGLEWALDAEIDLTNTDTDAEIDLTNTDVGLIGAARDPSGNGNGRGDTEPDHQVATRVRQWRAGDDPLAPTTAGSAPTRQTVRSRAWKNHALAEQGVGSVNQTRMAKGQPPRRWNPITRKRETAAIEVEDESYRVSWKTAGVDPFTDPLELDDDPPDS